MDTAAGDCTTGVKTTEAAVDSGPATEETTAGGGGGGGGGANGRGEVEATPPRSDEGDGSPLLCTFVALSLAGNLPFPEEDRGERDRRGEGERRRSV